MYRGRSHSWHAACVPPGSTHPFRATRSVAASAKPGKCWGSISVLCFPLTEKRKREEYFKANAGTFCRAYGPESTGGVYQLMPQTVQVVPRSKASVVIICVNVFAQMLGQKKQKQVELCYGKYICYCVIFTWWVSALSPWPTPVNIFPQSCFLSCCETVGQEINSVTDYPESSSPGGLFPSSPPLSCLIELTAEEANLMPTERTERKIYIYIYMKKIQHRDVGIHHIGVVKDKVGRGSD